MITIQKTLNVDVKNGQIFCRSPLDVNTVLGTSSASTNLHLYNIKKVGKNYIVPVQTVLDRISELEKRKEGIDKTLDILKQIETQIKLNKK